MAIDVGASCINRGANMASAYTRIAKNNPANANGTINSVCVYASTNNMSGIEFASFADEGSNVFSTNGNTNGSNFNCSVAESPKTFTAPGDFTAFNVNINDYIGIYWSSGNLEMDASGDGVWYKSGDNIPCSSATFTLVANRSISLYATGTEAGGVTMPIFMSNYLRQMGA